jgi:FimV-like protein
MDLVNEFKTEQGAEALYLLARGYHERGEYSRSNDLIFDHSQPFAGYDYWYGKQFIVLAENYIQMDEKFQAKATLESIVENSTNEQVKKEASQLLSTIN